MYLSFAKLCVEGIVILISIILSMFIIVIPFYFILSLKWENSLIIPLIVLSLVVLFNVFLLNRIRPFLKTWWGFFIKFFRVFFNLLEPLSDREKAILQKDSYYYRLLDNIEKQKFEKRIKRFIELKFFVPKGNLTEVSNRQKLLIASCAVQITFGLKEILYESFKQIQVFDEQFYNKRSKRHHKGEVNSKTRIIKLSWKDFEIGYLDYSSGRNLGLHEMAHALKLENIIKSPSEYFFLNSVSMRKYDKIAKKVFKDINNGEHDFLREYAGTNAEEFFAVCVEYFFEKTIEFKSKEPELYVAICNLLKQDPLTFNVNKL